MNERQRLIEENIGLVHSCALRFKGRGIEYEDLFQAGCLGLVKAASGFKSELGFVFSTYAVPVILGEVKRLFRESGAVKVSRSVKEKARCVRAEAERLSSALGREPSVSELACSLKLENAEIAELLLAGAPVVSLTAFEEDEEKQKDIPVESQEESLTEKISLLECLELLNDEDRQIIELRYYKSKTQSSVAEILGMTQVQVSRREKKILKEIREKLSA